MVLGDSYSSGEGTADYLEDDYVSSEGKIRCHPSKSAYGGVIGDDRTKIIACSGAVSYKMNDVKMGAADQLGMLAREIKPDVVFLTIRGNDVGLSGIVKQCFLGDCAADEASRLARIAAKSGWEEIYGQIAELVNKPDRLRHRDGKPVPVLVSPYPDPLWESFRGYCGTGEGNVNAISELLNAGSRLDIGSSPKEIITRKKILATLNAKVKDSVENARKEGALYTTQSLSCVLQLGIRCARRSPISWFLT